MTTVGIDKHALRACLSPSPPPGPGPAQHAGRSGVCEPVARKQHAFTPKGEGNSPAAWHYNRPAARSAYRMQTPASSVLATTACLPTTQS